MMDGLSSHSHHHFKVKFGAPSSKTRYPNGWLGQATTEKKIKNMLPFMANCYLVRLAVPPTPEDLKFWTWLMNNQGIRFRLYYVTLCLSDRTLWWKWEKLLKSWWKVVDTVSVAWSSNRFALLWVAAEVLSTIKGYFRYTVLLAKFYEPITCNTGQQNTALRHWNITSITC